MTEPFPWRQLWRWFVAPRISVAAFVAMTVIASIIRAALGW